MDSFEDSQPWYSVKCIFEHDRLAEADGATVYEERIVVLCAKSLDEAIERGEAEAQLYVELNADIRYSGFISAFHLFAAELTDNTEVYSLMRESSLSRGAYLDHFYDDGMERSQTYKPTG